MATAAKSLPDWEVGPSRYPTGKKVVLVALVCAPLLLVASIGAMLRGPLGAVVAAVLVVAVGSVAYRRLFKVSLRGADGAAFDDARFDNLVRGIANDHGFPVPLLVLLPDGGPNAMVLGGRRPTLAVTKSLLETYTRTEQEAVAAHCLTRIANGDLMFTRLGAGLGALGRRFAPRVGFEDDVHAAALTRYPPGLAKAIEKAEPAAGRDAAMWFVAHDPSHRHAPERVAALQDL